MDPDACLDELRTLRAWLQDPGEDDPYVLRFAELFAALDEWLMGGGFFPDDWRKANERHP